MSQLISNGAPLVALISGVTAATSPAAQALGDVFPEAQLWNIVDDRLISDSTAAGGVTARHAERMLRLIEHAALEGADAVLMTCSLYSFLAPSASVRFGIPVHGSNDAAFAQVVARGYRSVHLVSSVRLALDDSAERAADAFTSAGAQVDIVPVLAEGARLPSLIGDTVSTSAAILNALRASGRAAEVALLVNYTLAAAAPGVAAGTALPVLTGPWLAAQTLRDQLSGLSGSRSAAVG